MEGEETSRESDTTPPAAYRVAGRFDPDETEAANMLGEICNTILTPLCHLNLLYTSLDRTEAA